MTRPLSVRAQSAAGALALISLAACAPPRATPDPLDRQETTRVLAWDGGEELSVQVNADVHYVPGADNKVVITGPRGDIKDIVVEHGAIRHPGAHWRLLWGQGWRDHQVRIVLTAPHLASAGVSGSGSLDLGRLAQDRLELDVSGAGSAKAAGAVKVVKVSVSGSGGARLDELAADSLDADISGAGWIKAAGAARDIRVGISGSGHADLGALAAETADARISGAGSVSLAPKQAASLDISGAGGVRLLVEPQKLEVHRSGAGWVRHPNEK